MSMGQGLLDWMIESVLHCPSKKQAVQLFIGFILYERRHKLI